MRLGNFRKYLMYFAKSFLHPTSPPLTMGLQSRKVVSPFLYPEGESLLFFYERKFQSCKFGVEFSLGFVHCPNNLANVHNLNKVLCKKLCYQDFYKLPKHFIFGSQFLEKRETTRMVEDYLSLLGVFIISCNNKT
jgi:hypothetical protein